MPADLQNLSVLLLDDHRFMQQILRMMLQGLGVKKVVVATTTEEAIAHLDRDHFDLIMTDFRLAEDLTGADFARLVRASRSGSDRFVPIIACTADTTPRVVQQLRDAGVDEVLGKPVSAQSIWNKIAAVVNQRRRFVVAPQFFGPDRRRREIPLSGSSNRRKTVPRIPEN